MIHVFDLKIREAVDDLDFVIGEAVDDFPKPRLVGKTPDYLHLEIWEVIHHLDFVVGKTPHELDTPVNS